jgi:hypothetical protein
VFWARKESDASPVLLYLQVTCVAGRAVKTLTTDKAGTTPAVGYTEADKIGTVIKGERGASCEDPVHVKICAPATTYDREFAILCAPDGTKVAVQNVTPVDAPLGTAPTFEAWTLDSTAYTGAIAALTNCGSEKIDVTATQWFCANNAPISRTDFWDVFSTPKALIGSLWQDAAGDIVPAPAAGTYTQGECAKCEVTKHFEFAWYKEGTACRKIEVLKIVDCDDNLTLKGFEISGAPIAAFDPLNLFAGEAKELMRDICVTLKAVAPATNGVRWDLKEVTTTTPCGDTTVKYFDPDVSPMVEVAEDLIECINGEGKCPCCTETTPVAARKVSVYLQSNGGTVSMADIIAAVGTQKVQSVTVKQISGRGHVAADAGSGVPLDTGETWSWSAITGSDVWDHLGASALSMDAGGGEQRITATYIL